MTEPETFSPSSRQWTVDETTGLMAQHIHAFVHENGPDLEDHDLAIPCDDLPLDTRRAKWAAARNQKAALKVVPLRRFSGGRLPWEEPKETFRKTIEKLKQDPKVRFHESDRVAKKEPAPTIEEKNKAISKMADLSKSNPLAYVEMLNEWHEKLCTTKGALRDAVKLELSKRDDDGEQSQATKLIAIGVGDKVSLWHGNDAVGYATVLVGDTRSWHYENYRLDHRAFERWLITEYGTENRAKIGDKWIPQVPNSAAVRDAIRGLEGTARIKGKERQTALRVGGNRDVILLDLGRPDWQMVEITGDGWKPIAGNCKHVAFLRNDQLFRTGKCRRHGLQG